MKAAPLLLLALLAACGTGKQPNGAAANAAEPTIAAPAATEGPAAVSDDRIDCAVDGAAFARVCTVERMRGEAGLLLTVHAPSGAFRRLLVTRDGRGVAAADGAEPAKVSVLGPGRIEVAIGGDRYRLPATVAP